MKSARRRPGCVMGRKYSGSAPLARRRRGDGRGRRRLEPGEEFLGELEALVVGLVLDADPQFEGAFEAVIAIGVLHQPYDRPRIHLVLLLEQRIAALGPEIESADSEGTRGQFEPRDAQQVGGGWRQRSKPVDDFRGELVDRLAIRRRG